MRIRRCARRADRLAREPASASICRTAAIERAARHFPDRIWVVANADRRLPLLDRSVDLALSIYGRRNPAEVARVLAAAGYLLVAVPAADDLIELRELVQGRRFERDRASPA